MTFAWNGRQLQRATVGDQTLSFAYNADGIRTRKSVNSGTTRYVVNGTQVLFQQTGISEPIYFEYDANGHPYSMTYGGTTVYYLCNLSGDVFALLDADGNRIVEYTYGPFGQLLEVYGSAASTLGAINPLRYRGYYYDTETGLYYLNSRYYDPEVGRFINADGYVSTGQGVLGYNMFVYCGNNPVNRKDPTGRFWITAIIVTAVVAVCTLGLSGCSAPSAPSVSRSDLANAPDLDISTASPSSYNCYGNGIRKQINTNPTGYTRGDSTRKTFESVKKDLGSNNVRELTSINDPVGDDEFKVALKCGPVDYHFIRLDGDKWYNKSGTAPGLYIDQSVVAGDIWYAMWMNNGQAYIGDPRYGYPYYNDETIYFAVKVGWDAQ